MIATRHTNCFWELQRFQMVQEKLNSMIESEIKDLVKTKSHLNLELHYTHQSCQNPIDIGKTYPSILVGHSTPKNGSISI